MNDKRYNDDFINDGFFCDCCGATEEADLHTLNIECSITLCALCIRRFYALLGNRVCGERIKITDRT